VWKLFCVIQHEKFDMTSMAMRFKTPVSLRCRRAGPPAGGVRAAPPRRAKSALCHAKRPRNVGTVFVVTLIRTLI
jgi:hypothetical protein